MRHKVLWHKAEYDVYCGHGKMGKIVLPCPSLKSLSLAFCMTRQFHPYLKKFLWKRVRIWQFLKLSFIVNCRKEFSDYTCKSFLSCWIDKKISRKSVSKPTEAISNHTNWAYNCQYRHIYPKNSSGQKFNQWNHSVMLNNCRNICHVESQKV